MKTNCQAIKHKKDTTKNKKPRQKIKDENVILSYTQKRTIYYRKLRASSLEPLRVGEGEVILNGI
jgi:hypothetical protein